jgi:large subunit ribosomal protein L35
VPKLKTRRGVAKRFKVTGRGLIRRARRSFRNHILTKKSSKRKRHLARGAPVDATDVERVRRALPYG